MNIDQLDEIDVYILEAIRDNPHISIRKLEDRFSELAVRLGRPEYNIRHTKIGEKRKALEDMGFIVNKGYEISPKAIGLPVTVFMTFNFQRYDNLNEFLELMKNHQFIVGFWTINADIDYIARFEYPDIDTHNKFVHNKLRGKFPTYESLILQYDERDIPSLSLDHLWHRLGFR